MLGMLTLASCNDGKDELTDSRLTYYAELTMEGDEFMIVPVGTEFVDPGCKAQIYDKASGEIKDITREQLLAENPALVDQIAQQAVTNERQRIQDIMEMKMPGYDAMAEEAIKNGTDANVFMRNMIMESKKKGSTFIQNRQAETAPAKNVAAGAPETDTGDGTAEDAAAKQIAEYAKEMAASGNGMY